MLVKEVNPPHEPCLKHLLKSLKKVYKGLKDLKAVTPVVILVDGDQNQAMCGSHRIAAAKKVHPNLSIEEFGWIVIDADKLRRKIESVLSTEAMQVLAAKHPHWPVNRVKNQCFLVIDDYFSKEGCEDFTNALAWLGPFLNKKCQAALEDQDGMDDSFWWWGE